MLKTAKNEWSLKAVQLETALMALGEVVLPGELSGLQREAEEKLKALLQAWLERQPDEPPRQWKEEAQEGGTPRDAELRDVVEELRKESEPFTLYRRTSGEDVVETLVNGERAWMAAGGEYYYGQWDEEQQVLEVGRDDDEDEPGSGVVLTLTGELVYSPS